MANKIGVINCLCCKAEIPLGEQKTTKAMYSCSWCGVQVYSRGAESDKILRDLSRPMPGKAAPAGEPAPNKASGKKFDAAGREVKS